MPTLHWIGKDKVINHHLDVPYKVLEHQYRFGSEESSEFGKVVLEDLEAKGIQPSIHPENPNSDNEAAKTQSSEFGKAGFMDSQDLQAKGIQPSIHPENPNSDNEAAKTQPSEFGKAGFMDLQDLQAKEIQPSIHPKNPNSDNYPNNKIIHGDNLEALKSLLPEYEGKIKCIYIDPPYNTGNESWVYNDNVNDPKIKKWLGQVVGKEAEDLTRHDKWLCMMYPRLKLLHKLLADDGVIFISIDNFEYNYLSLLLEEIFGRENNIETIIWKKSYGGGSKSKHLVNLHEYIFFYAKNIKLINELELSPDDSIIKYYKFKDEKFDVRGPFRLQALATTSMDDRPNLRYPIKYKSEEIWPTKQWQWSKERVEAALQNNELVIEKKKDNWSVNYKQYLKSAEGVERGRKLYSIIEGIYTQQGTADLKALIPDTKFTFPKPPNLIQTLLELSTDKNSIILDSFAGSGTTAHAVLNLNKQDGGNRKFILIEMETYAETITAERVKRVINGYAGTEGTGGSFDFYTLGEPLFLEDGLLNENLPLQKIREYIWYTETGRGHEARGLSDAHTAQSAPQSSHLNPFLGTHQDTAYYFYYLPQEITTLDHDFLAAIKTKAEQYLIYADNCLLTPNYMAKNSIVFKKIPRDVRRF